jgi:hypothetical protein
MLNWADYAVGRSEPAVEEANPQLKKYVVDRDTG